MDGWLDGRPRARMLSGTLAASWWNELNGAVPATPRRGRRHGHTREASQFCTHRENEFAGYGRRRRWPGRSHRLLATTGSILHSPSQWRVAQCIVDSMRPLPAPSIPFPTSPATGQPRQGEGKPTTRSLLGASLIIIISSLSWLPLPPLDLTLLRPVGLPPPPPPLLNQALNHGDSHRQSIEFGTTAD